MQGLIDQLNRGFDGRYQLHHALGGGGMAAVFEAYDIQHDRQVAIKVLHADVAAAIGAERFLHEIRVTARLQHPHILPLYESGRLDGFLYYVMPLAEGGSIREKILREGQIEIAEVLRITRVVGGALAFAHQHQVLHRDIKPENILLQGGEPMVADFGIALALDAARGERLTHTGLTVGTPEYMSPEQATGEQPLDARTDIYSLACTVYEMLAGEPPYTGATAQSVLAKRLMHPVPRVSVVRPVVAPDTERALERALQRVPADRFRTVTEFVEVLCASSESPSRAPGERPSWSASSVAVLPFVNMSPDEDNEFLSDGIAEELIHRLGKLDGLRVVARTSSFAFKGERVAVPVIGQQLNVDAVLEGSVRKARDTLRITSRLVSVADGYEVWSERYERKVDDVFALQDELTDAIINALAPSLRGEMVGGRGATTRRPGPVAHDFEAYELYLKGRFSWNRRTETGLEASVDHLQEATVRDPDFAPAWAALADSYLTLGVYGTRPPEQTMPRAKDAASRALALDADLAEAMVSLACLLAVYDWEWGAAAREFERAIAASGQYPTAHQWYATQCLAPLGRFAEAREQLERAVRIDPLSVVIRTSQGVISYFAREYDRAIREYESVLDADPGFGMAHYFLAQAYEELGDVDRAVASFETARTLNGGSPECLAGLAHAYAKAEDGGTAGRLRDELLAQAGRRYVSPVLLAQVETGLGNLDRAFQWLEDAHQRRAADLIWLNVRPVFEPLRGDPRFGSLRTALGWEGSVARR